jgi:hypothetical protein
MKSMSTLRKSLWPPALLLAVLLASATPAAARPGIWIYLEDGHSLSISLINLTQHRLLITKNSFSLYCVQGSLPSQCPEYQSNPFQGHGALNLDSYRTATWKSHGAEGENGWAWSGSFSVKPEGMDAWEVSINTHTENPHCCFHPGKGTWIYLQTDFSATTGNPDWSKAWNSFAYGIWVVPNFVTDYAHMATVMTLSGTQLAVSLYSPDNLHVVVVLRETFWDGVQAADYIGWRLGYVDEPSNSVP